MRTFRKIVSSVLAVCLLASSGVIAGFAATDNSSVGAGDTDPNVLAGNSIDTEYAYDGNDLGATYTPAQTVFKVWSPTATEVTLNRYATGSDDETGHANLGSTPMEKMMDGDKWTGVWTTTVTGDIVNTFYTYTITSAHPATGEMQTAETQDVYSVATGVNGKRSMVCDLDSTDPAGWANDAHVVPDKQTDASVWEVHVKDFSWDSTSNVSAANRGKYLAFTETGTTVNGEGKYPTMVDYLVDLGVKTVQINPFYDFGSINEAGAADQFNWGYDPQNYNVPEGSYSSDPYDGNVRINECKQMIQALHNAGISVVMDVVYNHTYSNHKDYSCFQATVPDYYYRLKYDADQGASFFSNGSGCGNDVASERAMVHKYVVDSCMYWVNEYHVDGFRFDLMGLMDVDLMNDIRAKMDEVDTRLTIWGEGWEMSTYSAGYYYKLSDAGKLVPVRMAKQGNASRLDSRVGLFNDSIRDGMKGSVFDASAKGFITGVPDNAKNIKAGVYGNSKTSFKSGWTAKTPEQCVNYAACHDNATLYDRIANSYTHVGIRQGDELYAARNEDALAVNRLAAAIIYTAQGIPFILAGEEMARTKYGNENSYNAPAELNKIRWDRSIDYADLVSYYKGLMKIRENFTPLTASTKDYESKIKLNGSFTDTSTLVYGVITNDQPGEWSKMAVVYNASPIDQNSVVLPDSTIGTDFQWVVLAKGDRAGLNPIEIQTGRKVKVPAHSALIAVDKASYDTVGVSDNTGMVEINYVDGANHAINGVAPIHLTGEIGSSYTTIESAAVPPAYIFDHINGNAQGVYTAEPQTVNYVYRDAAKVTVEYKHENGTELADSVTLYGEVGDNYTAPACDTIPEQYNFKEVVGNVTGQFTAEAQTVTYVYKDAARVTVNYLYKDGTVLADPDVYYGEPGGTYDLPGCDTIPEKYMFDYADGDTQGEFTEEPKVVNFYYTDFVPFAIREHGDVDGDGDIDINDVTAYQRILAEYVEISAEDLALLDFNSDGRSSILDVTMLQMYLAEMYISQGTVTIHYYADSGEGDPVEIFDTVSFKDNVGDDLVAPAQSKFGYELDETRLPAVEGKKVRFGSPTVVNYYYVESSDKSVRLHFKHAGDATWVPNLWIWNTENYTGNVWPGNQPVMNAETGWYDYNFTLSDKEKVITYNLIVSMEGNPQTNDLTDFTGRDLWVVISDGVPENKTNFLTIYTANPDTVADPSQFMATYTSA